MAKKKKDAPVEAAEVVKKKPRRKKKEVERPTVEELELKAAKLERELFNLRNERAIQRKLEKPHLLKAKRHERARVLTLLTQAKRTNASGS